MSLFPRARGVPKKWKMGQPFNISANLTHKFVVPKRKAWQVIHAYGDPADSSTLDIKLYDEDGIEIGRVSVQTAATVSGGGPSTVSGSRQLQTPLLLMEDEYVFFQFGTAQTSLTAKVYLKVIEFDIDEILGMKEGK